MKFYQFRKFTASRTPPAPKKTMKLLHLSIFFQNIKFTQIWTIQPNLEKKKFETTKHDDSADKVTATKTHIIQFGGYLVKICYIYLSFSFSSSFSFRYTKSIKKLDTSPRYPFIPALTSYPLFPPSLLPLLIFKEAHVVHLSKT